MVGDLVGCAGEQGLAFRRDACLEVAYFGCGTRTGGVTSPSALGEISKQGSKILENCCLALWGGTREEAQTALLPTCRAIRGESPIAQEKSSRK